MTDPTSLYEFILKLVESAGFISIIGFIVGYKTKTAELNLSEKHRKQKFLDEKRIEIYKNFFPLQLTLAELKAKKILSNDENIQAMYSETLLKLNILIPEMQMIAGDRALQSLNELSRVVNSENLAQIDPESYAFTQKSLIEQIQKTAKISDQVLLAIREEFISTNRTFIGGIKNCLGI